ncbi:hypothetical protein [Ferrimonas balearica]|uniref:hypothetical protein n=1 Tax=Ferrimonas balearica TaxID=44012 RepID=UPI001C98EAD9|nr:hypothetical protein [Ferrimonas balearica]MBY5992508.1 hypothetical protein [Ferrimonas balearica]
MLTPEQHNRLEWLNKALEAIDNALLGILSSGFKTMQLNGRAATSYSPGELSQYRRELAAERLQLLKIDAGEIDGESATDEVRVIL